MVPSASPNDVYFDIEGFPLVEQGLEYLLGAIVLESGQPKFYDWWAHDETQERLSFERFVDWTYARWRQDPGMHVYHYAPYEVTAMRRLMTRFGTREDEVDTLLRCGVFVDLYRIIRQGLLLGASDYSLKTVEKLYKEQRGGGVTTAAGSIVFYARWLESDQSQDWQQSSILKDIRDYNEEDCVSTWQLAEWLRNKQHEHGIRCEVQTDSAAGETDEAEEVLPTAADALARHQLAMDLLAGIPVAAADREEDQERWQLQEMLGYLLEFHRRDAKPVWWALFERHQMREEELIDELSCLGGLKRTDDAPEPIKRSMGYWYSFDPDQDTRLRGPVGLRVSSCEYSLRSS